MSPKPNGAKNHLGRQPKWVVGVLVTASVAVALVLLFLLTQATNNRELYEQHYSQLLFINAAAAGVLLAVIVWFIVRLFLRLKRGKFGSRLLGKLAGIFVLVGFLPGLLIYAVSYQFVSRSIESWFDVKVESALQAGLGLGRTTLDAMTTELEAKVRTAADQLGPQPDGAAALMLDRLREQLGVDDMVLWNGAGGIIGSAGQSRYELQPTRPTASQLRRIRDQRVHAQIEGLEEGFAPDAAAHIKAWGVVASSSVGLLNEPRYLQISKALPATLVANALAVQQANMEYQERTLGREGLKRMYIGTLTLSLFLAVFGAVIVAVVLGNQLVRPLLVLAEGVRQVSDGDLGPKTVLLQTDELSALTRSFADMTQQLADARTQVEFSVTQLTEARQSLQTLLDNLTAGVMVLAHDGRIALHNPSAGRVLRVELEPYLHQRLTDIVQIAEFAQEVQSQFAEFEKEGHQSRAFWQRSFELHTTGQGIDLKSVTLIARGALLPDGGHLLVLDDISDIVSAQRSQAWAEVARRLAHEIKNPLTPIQLSAERLQMKLDGHLQPPQAAIVKKSVKTIVEQVDAMKRLVNEFRDYARLPRADMKPLDLNALVREVLSLYEQDTPAVMSTVVIELDENCPMIAADAQQLRQVIHNLLQNAQDANDGSIEKKIYIKTQWQLESRRVRMVISDQGAGFPSHILQRAFEPYVTTKAKGTGLGLAVVKKIADEHEARIELSNRVVDAGVDGAQVSLSFSAAGDTGTVPTKA